MKSHKEGNFKHCDLTHPSAVRRRLSKDQLHQSTAEILTCIDHIVEIGAEILRSALGNVINALSSMASGSKKARHGAKNTEKKYQASPRAGSAHVKM